MDATSNTAMRLGVALDRLDQVSANLKAIDLETLADSAENAAAFDNLLAALNDSLLTYGMLLTVYNAITSKT